MAVTTNPSRTARQDPNLAKNNIIELAGTGAPVDGVSGTGVGQAGKGSRYTDFTNANLYINGGTLASPTWKLVTRAA